MGSSAVSGRGAARGPAQQQPDPARNAEGEPALPRSVDGAAGEEVLPPAFHDVRGEGVHADIVRAPSHNRK
jgi:hypothetical protein